MTNQDKQFLRIMQDHLMHYAQLPSEDVLKLVAMARRPTRKAAEDEIKRLRAENTRLRDVLDRIAYGKYHWEVGLQEEARAALAPPKQEEK